MGSSGYRECRCIDAHPVHRAGHLRAVISTQVHVWEYIEYVKTRGIVESAVIFSNELTRLQNILNGETKPPRRYISVRSV